MVSRSHPWKALPLLCVSLACVPVGDEAGEEGTGTSGSETRIFSQASPEDAWQPLDFELPLSEVFGVSMSRTGDTYRLRGFADGELNCISSPMWADIPNDALLGTSQQYLRPVDDTNLVLDAPSFGSLSPDGLCLAREIAPQQWRIDDLPSTTHSEFDVDVEGSLLWIPE